MFPQSFLSLSRSHYLIFEGELPLNIPLIKETASLTLLIYFPMFPKTLVNFLITLNKPEKHHANNNYFVIHVLYQPCGFCHMDSCKER